MPRFTMFYHDGNAKTAYPWRVRILMSTHVSDASMGCRPKLWKRCRTCWNGDDWRGSVKAAASQKVLKVRSLGQSVSGTPFLKSVIPVGQNSVLYPHPAWII
mmetsp:Transcript_45754/g.99696  ORF Transcript_45754/g.99696 Transcript_45754/m.99696 type:complete len:102 (-) Transcript_45754:314-619(-)